MGSAFVTKLNPAGQGSADLVYSTYLGGSNDDRGESIVVDGSHHIYITGFTQSSGYPVTSGTALQPTFGGGLCNGTPCGDAIVSIFDPAQTGVASLLYSSFLGGSSFDLGHAIAIDSAGMIYIAGETGSTNFPLVNPIQNTCTGGCTPLPMTDAFLQVRFHAARRADAAVFDVPGRNDVDSPGASRWTHSETPT